MKPANGLHQEEFPTSTLPKWLLAVLTGMSGLLVAYLFVHHGLMARVPARAELAARALDGLAVLLLALDVLPLYRHRRTWRHVWYHCWFDTVLLAAAIPASLI